MAETRLAATKNRSVVGMMNEFEYLGAAWRDSTGSGDVLVLSLPAAQVPCGPLYRRNVTPDQELAAFVREHGG
jgi:hypothetical protein